MDSIDAFRAADLDQRGVLALVDELIRLARTSPDWANPTVFMFQAAIGAWLNAQEEPARDSLERRLIGHFLFPPGNFVELPDYLAAIGRRVEAPADGRPTWLEQPQPVWHLVAKALWAGCYYE